MQLETGPHRAEAEIEQYSMGTLPQDQVGPFEEHILVCEGCQDQLLEMEAYVNAIRTVSPKLRGSRRTRWVWTIAWPRPAWAAVGAVGLAAILIISVPAPFCAPELATVTLEASRGIDGVPQVKAVAGQGLSFEIDLTQIPVAPSYRLEIVNSVGRREAETVILPTAGNLIHKLPRGLSAGRHYIRLYGANRELLREFGLAIGTSNY